MATERLQRELATGDLPVIGAGNFRWQPVDAPSVFFSRTADSVEPKLQQVGAVPDGSNVNLPAQRMLGQITTSEIQDELTDQCYPLNLLQNRIFAGPGYNVVWRPRGKVPDKGKPVIPTAAGVDADILQINLTAETMTFAQSLGDVPNRGQKGQGQEDIMLKGISYAQRVGAFDNDKTGKADLDPPKAIHFEPGVFMFVPASTSPNQPATINRMGSIPHGTTINAQGIQPPIPPTKRPFDPTKDIPPSDILPFKLNTPSDKPAKQKIFSGPDHHQLDFKGNFNDDRLPTPLNKFSSLITDKVFFDPNEILRIAVKDQEIDSWATFTLSTKPKDGLVGGGTGNIGFLQGTDSNMAQGFGNAHAVEMTVQYWIQTVGTTLTFTPSKRKIQVSNAAGVLGPTFELDSTIKLTGPMTMRFTWTQIQYSQNVTLNFNSLSWPHVSVATLGDTSNRIVKLPA